MTTGAIRNKQLLDNLRDIWTCEVPIVIRSARHEDLAKLEWFGSYAHFRNLYQRTWLDHEAGRRLMIVADLHNFPVAQVWLDVIPNDFAYLYAFRVFEPLRGLGIGTKLMQAAHQLAWQHGYRQVQLAVEKSNHAARRLYERHGYQIFGQQVDVWSYTDQYGVVQWVEEDVYKMRRWLHTNDQGHSS